MLATSKNGLCPGHNHLLITGIDDPTLVGALAIIKVSGHQHWWLWPGNRTFLEVASMVVSWWIVPFLHSGTQWVGSNEPWIILKNHHEALSFTSLLYIAIKWTVNNIEDITVCGNMRETLLRKYTSRMNGSNVVRALSVKYYSPGDFSDYCFCRLFPSKWTVKKMRLSLWWKGTVQEKHVSNYQWQKLCTSDSSVVTALSVMYCYVDYFSSYCFWRLFPSGSN